MPASAPPSKTTTTTVASGAELARGLHPAVLEHGLDSALNSLASRASVATTVSYEASGRLFGLALTGARRAS